MKKIYSLFVAVLVLVLASGGLYAQQSIGGVTPTRPHYYSVLELISQYKSGVYGGLRLPQMTTSQRDGLGIPALTGGAKDSAQGLTVFNTTINCVEYWNGTQWNSLCGMSSTNIVQIIKDSTSNWYGGNTTLQDSIINTVTGNAKTATSPNNTVTLGNNTNSVLNNLTVDVKPGANNTVMTTNGSGAITWAPAATYVDTAMLAGSNISITRSASGNTINATVAGTSSVTSPSSTINVTGTNTVLGATTVDIKPGANNTVMTTNGSGAITWAPAATYVDTAMLAGTNITINRSASGNTISAKDTAMLAGSNISITRSASGNTISATDTAMLAGSNITITRSASGNTINSIGDNLGNHTATMDLNMANFNINNAAKTSTQTEAIALGTDGNAPAAGYVATAADASGNIVWKAPAAGISGAGTVIAVNGQLVVAQEITCLMTADFTTSSGGIVPIGNITNKIIDNQNTFTGTASGNSFTVVADGIYQVIMNVQLTAPGSGNPVLGIVDNSTGKWIARVNDNYPNANSLQTYTLITAVQMFAGRSYSFGLAINATSTTILSFSTGGTGTGPVSYYSVKRLK